MALCALLAGIGNPARAYTLYDDPIKLQAYVTEPRAVILDGMQRYGWVVKESSDGLILAHLNHKGYDLEVEIRYSPSLISVKQVYASSPGCSGDCGIEEGLQARWRLNLRRGIMHAIHELALADATVKAN